MLGRYVTDLEVGDELGPIEYVLEAAHVREYAHGCEESAERNQGVAGQLAPPTIFHADKVRLLDLACPDGNGPSARMHLEWHAEHVKAIPVGRRLRASGRVSQRYVQNGRDRIVIDFALHDADTGDLYALYHDTSMLGVQPQAPS
ncbi:MAG: hypothetical protein AB7L13_05340 [Acidimicrobiia bacterium]